MTGEFHRLQHDIRSVENWQPPRSSGLPLSQVMLLLVGDVLALASAWQLARFLNQFYSPLPPELVWWVWLGLPSVFWIFIGLTLILFAHYGLYGRSARTKDYLRTAQLISFVYLLSLLLGYFYDPKLDPPRSLFLTAWLNSVSLVIIARLITNVWLSKVRARQPINIFLIARANRLRQLSNTIEKRSNYTIAGAAMASMANSKATFQSILAAQPMEVLVEDVPDVELASSLYWRLRGAGIPLRLLPSSREMLYRRGMPEIFAGLPTLKIEKTLFQSLDYRFKRWMDVIMACLGLIILSPLFLGIAIAIKATSPGPVFFRQERVGLHGKVFQVWKFRTMTANAAANQAELEVHNENPDGVLFKIRKDPRVTSVGRLLRQTSLDELPQLLNVVVGQMSIVGPRPLPLRDISKFETWHHIRHQVLPGITGLWQISGRSDLESFDAAARLDLHYIDNWSLNLDLDILMETVRVVLFRKGAY
ncbi:MAG: sugar transferase [Cyanobacteria bacterium J06635_15]